MSQFAQDLIESLTEVLAHAKGEPNNVRITIVNGPDVRALREHLHMSQADFASSYHIPLATLRGWEQGRRVPDQTAAAYLNVIARLPSETRDALRNDAA